TTLLAWTDETPRPCRNKCSWVSVRSFRARYRSAACSTASLPCPPRRSLLCGDPSGMRSLFVEPAVLAFLGRFRFSRLVRRPGRQAGLVPQSLFDFPADRRIGFEEIPHCFATLPQSFILV